METKGLTTGNLVNYIWTDYDEPGNPIVTSVHCVKDNEAPCKFEKDYYEPIPLTEKWLADFGFSFGIRLQDFIHGKHQFIELGILNGYFSEHGYFIFSYPSCLKIQYVHQLQNLYFALTGEKLTLKVVDIK